MSKHLHFLVVDDEADIADLLCLFLSQEFSASFTIAHGGMDAIELLKQNSQEYSLVFSDFRMAYGTGGDVLDFIRSQNLGIPFILATGDQLDEHPEIKNLPKVGYAQKPFDDQAIKREVKRLLDMEPTTFLTSNYIGISVNTLLKIKRISCSLFVKLNDSKFVRIQNSGTVFETTEFERMKNKGVDTLYVEQQEFAQFIAEFKGKVVNNMLFSGFQASTSEALLISSALQEVINGVVKNLGLSQETHEMAKKNILLVQSLIDRHENLQSIFAWALESEQGYCYQHSVLLSLLTCEAATNYNFENPYASEILALASFLHDSSLNDYQAKNEDRFLSAIMLGLKTNQEDLEIIKAHPTKAYEAANLWPHCPKEVLEIIQNHHERPDGTGFPLGLKAQEVSVFTACFIVCEDLVKSYLELKNSERVIESWHKKQDLYREIPYKNFYDLFTARLQKDIKDSRTA